MSIQHRLAYLVGRVLQQAATTEELQELSELISADQTGEVTREVELLLQKDLAANAPDYDETYWDGVASHILAADHPQELLRGKVIPMRPRRRPWIAAAVVAGLLLLAGGLYWQQHTSTVAPVATTPIAHTNDVAPGSNKAILILADGTEMPLDSSANGALAQQGQTKISKPGPGQLVYAAGGKAGKTDLRYNTLRTPRGGQFQVTLPDGSKVWLNAASTLRYPTAFTGAERKVELNGEAYFEVAGNAAQPFKVSVPTGHTDSMEVAVLGTQFNIMAYEDEVLVKTTLLQGAVQVSKAGNRKKLVPGQGASLDKASNALALQEHVNTEEAVAWKNGYIQLEGNDIQSAMRLIARWYDVEVIYKAPVPAHFRGIIPRNVPVSQVLKMMEMTGEVHFEIKGRQLIVSP